MGICFLLCVPPLCGKLRVGRDRSCSSITTKNTTCELLQTHESCDASRVRRDVVASESRPQLARHMLCRVEDPLAPWGLSVANILGTGWVLHTSLTDIECQHDVLPAERETHDLAAHC